MKKNLLVVLPFVTLASLISGSLAQAAPAPTPAADCGDLAGRYCLDPKPMADSVYLVITQTGCTQVHLTWYDGQVTGADQLRTTDNQFHSFGDEGGFQVTERWSWIGVDKKILQSEQNYVSDKSGYKEAVNALYFLDTDGNLDLEANTYDNGVPTMGAGSIYYRVH
jgi:hypothetical protein